MKEKKSTEIQLLFLEYYNTYYNMRYGIMSELPFHPGLSNAEEKEREKCYFTNKVIDISTRLFLFLAQKIARVS